MGGGATFAVGKMQTKATEPGLCTWAIARSNIEGRAVHRNFATTPKAQNARSFSTPADLVES